MATTGGVTTTTDDVYITEQWSAELNVAIQLDIVVAGLFKDRSPELKGGDTLNVPSRHHLATATKSAGTDLDPETITETRQQFIVSTHQAVAQKFEDIAEVQSKYEIRAGFTEEGSYSLARSMDVAGANLFDDNTIQTIGTLGAETGYDQLVSGRTFLRNSPVKGRQVIVVPPATTGGFLKQEVFINALYNGDTKGMAVREAQVGKVFGATIYESQLLPGTAPSAYGHWWAFGHFFKVVQRQPTSHAWYSPLAVSWIVSMDQIYQMFELQEADEAASATTTARLGGVRIACTK